jgi:hypothetical protein
VSPEVPIGFAFSRIKGAGWMTMLRQSVLNEHYRDMSRSLESMRQMIHQPELLSDRPLRTAYEELLNRIGQVLTRFASSPKRRPKPEDQDYIAMKDVESQFATFAELLLAGVLIPYWKSERIGLVEGKDELEDKQREPGTPLRILLAEEFLVIRYVCLIRGVLANLRCVMVFISVAFALAVWAWNSYPFQPRQELDGFFTLLLALLGGGVVWVFAQMHRNAILSRTAGTRENELGADFYVRLAAFGALPVLTWLAYQFPSIGGMIYRFIQPVEPVLK